MKFWATTVFALLFATFVSLQYSGTASGQDGWTTLFDGKNLEHWDGDGTASFVIEDGAVIAKDKKQPPPI